MSGKLYVLREATGASSGLIIPDGPKVLLIPRGVVCPNLPPAEQTALLPFRPFGALTALARSLEATALLVHGTVVRLKE